MAHAGAAVEVQPQAAASRLAADWSAANTAHRQDPAAETRQAAGETQAKSLREAVVGADPAERLVQGQPGRTVRELRVRVAEAGVEVRLSPAARELHVAVRSPQPELREALRSELDELASRLAERGLEAQIWRPSNSSATSGAAERGWEGLRAHFAEGGESGSGRRGQPEQQPAGDQRRHHPDPRWGEAWSDLEGEASPPVWRLRR
ncbi:MAG: flagellar hook-length control protein FliK [Bryobacteraceae bacterium]|nr:flagellar hook-length control protein FliK [Bryobacteraceae bacterium]